ncbi:hypothetical protein [Rhodococcus triatomae]
MTDRGDSGEVAFAEPGARWNAVVLGPALCVVVLIADIFVGAGVHLLGLALFAVVLAGFVALQVLAARRHASVEVTATRLRCGSESVDLDDIAEVLPLADPMDEDLQPWETARVLGELTGVPRRRTPVGLRLVDGGTVRAWARDGDGLRSVLESVVGRTGRADEEGAIGDRSDS